MTPKESKDRTTAVCTGTKKVELVFEDPRNGLQVAQWRSVRLRMPDGFYRAVQTEHRWGESGPNPNFIHYITFEKEEA